MCSAGTRPISVALTLTAYRLKATIRNWVMCLDSDEWPGAAQSSASSVNREMVGRLKRRSGGRSRHRDVLRYPSSNCHFAFVLTRLQHCRSWLDRTSRLVIYIKAMPAPIPKVSGLALSHLPKRCSSLPLTIQMRLDKSYCGIPAHVRIIICQARFASTPEDQQYPALVALSEKSLERQAARSGLCA